MKEKINQELIKLQQELSKLQTAAEQLSKAEKASTDVINAVEDLRVKFDESLKAVFEETQVQLKDTFEPHKQELEEAIQAVQNLEKSVRDTETATSLNLNKLAQSHKEQIETVNKLLRNYLDLATSTAKLSDMIDSVDFPANLSKISVNITDINTELRTVKNEVASMNPILLNFESRIQRNNKKINFAMIIGILAFFVILFTAWQTAVVPKFPDLDVFGFISGGN